MSYTGLSDVTQVLHGNLAGVTVRGGRYDERLSSSSRRCKAAIGKTAIRRLKSNQLLSGSFMFNAVFVYTINIKCRDEVLDRPWKRLVYRMEKQFCLPFVPVEKSLFLEGDDELCVDYAHYDLIAEKFIVDCGGGLCNDDQEVQEALDYQLSKGWTVARRHESR